MKKEERDRKSVDKPSIHTMYIWSCNIMSEAH